MIPKRSLYYALALNYAAMMCLAIAVNLIPVFLTTLSTDLGGTRGLTHEQLGRIVAVTFVGLVGGILLTGPLADRLGAKPFAVLGNLLVAVGLVVLGMAHTYGAVLASVAVMGFGAGVLDMILSPIVCAFQPERRTSAMNWLHSFYCFGAVATVFVGSVALRCGVGWRTLSLWLIAAPALVAIGFLSLHIPPLLAEGQQRMRLRQLCRRPFFLVALAAIFLAGATELGMAQWLPDYAEKSLGYTTWVGGMSLMAFSIAMTVGRILAGMLGHHLPALRLMAICCWLSVVLFALSCFAPWRPLALAACVLVGLTGSCLWPSMLGVAADRFPHGGASMFGLLGATGNFGGIFMPWMVGVIADHSALNFGLSTAIFCPLLMAFLLWWMQRQATEADGVQDMPLTVETP